MNKIPPLIINIDDISLSDNEKEIISHELIGGIIIFSHNYSSISQLQNLIHDIKSINNNILVSIDHEGGRVQRLKNNFTILPSFEDIGRIYSTDKSLALNLSYAAGYIAGYELSNIGFDINYSPVIDIGNENSKVLQNRTFGNTVQKIYDLSKKYISGSIDSGIIPVLKHFPGHGAVNDDSHTTYCQSDKDFDKMSETDIRLFKDLFNKFNLPIMTGHIAFSNIDKNIVTYSKKWLIQHSQNIFASKPMFISDDLEMYAAKSNENTASKRVILALEAGCNMIIATTMQQKNIISNKESYLFFLENYLTDEIIEYYHKNHDRIKPVLNDFITKKSVDLYKDSLRLIGDIYG